MDLRIRTVALLLLLSRLPALELPSGVLAVVEDKAVDSTGIAFTCGGCVVLISGDGLALSLEEAIPVGRERVVLIAAGGVRVPAVVVRRGTTSSGVLLRLERIPDGVKPIISADSTRVALGDVAWTAGNSFAVLQLDGVAALSRGIISGSYTIPSDSPPARGRMGRILSTYRGPVFETDAAVNDGNHGGALLDDHGHLIALVSLGLARERRMGTAIPVHLLNADLGLDRAELAPAGCTDATLKELRTHAEAAARSTALVYFERPKGLGNPQGVPRPAPITAATPLYDRERMAQQWDIYYHEQQVFYTDQPVTALVIDHQQGLLLTAASNLHGEAERGRVLLDGGASIDCTVVARDIPLDLALLRAVKPLPGTDAPLATAPSLACGDAVLALGRHAAPAGYTIAAGVVSVTTRHFAQSESSFYQTDALANYGNLGGPVIDLSGAVVGMVVTLGPNEHWPWFINSGVAMFIDSTAILRALPRLMRGETRQQENTFGLGIGWNRQQETSLVLDHVVPGTGAAAAGLAPGDELLALDGIDVHNQPDVTRIILRHRPGDHIAVRLRRAGKELTVDVELRIFQ